jgi:hypothetical protein
MYMSKSKGVIEKVLLLLLIILSVGAWYWSFQTNNILTYNDAASHLNIARRVVDNLTPGLAQIGTVWLPLPHLLMLVLAWNDTLWHTAIAGSIVSVFSFIVFVVYVYKSLYMLTESRWSGFTGALVAASNPNLLYLQTTPMTESLLLATFGLSTYYFIRYMKTDQMVDLFMTGIWVALATLTRYDGWFLYGCMLAVLTLRTLLIRGRKKAEGIFLLFMVIGGFGIFLWLVWNKSIFGDALYFMNGPYSAHAQQTVLKSVGQLPTEGSWYNSLTYFTWSVISNNGTIIIALALCGLAYICTKIKNKEYLYLGMIVTVPFLFNVLALYAGQSAMNVPQAPNNPGYFNIRYGLLVLPSLAILIGILGTNKLFRYLALIAIAIQIGVFVRLGMPVTLIDGLQGLKNTYYTVEASKWLRENYQGGLILTSLASHDAFVARTGLPMRNYIHEGTRENWNNALQTPGPNVTYIALLSFPPDSVYRAISENPAFTKHYNLVHTYGTFEIYKRK